jgi:glycerate dehydrogenase
MKIVVIEGYSLNPGDLSWAGLEALGELTVYDRSRQDQIVERCKDAEMVFTNKEPLGRDIMAQLPGLKFIGVLATGYNCVDVAAAKDLGIVVSNVPGYGTNSVVQLTFALLLELTLHVQDHSHAVKNGDWSRSPDFCFWNYPLIELAGKTMGIIGFGDIGKKVADVATAFGMKIIANSRTRTDQTHRTNFRWAPVEELLEQSDVVSLHCPLTPETTGLINRESLKRMKPSAFLLNTSRGPLVIDQDLADALHHDVIAGAGIDVLSKEPPLQ